MEQTLSRTIAVFGLLAGRTESPGLGSPAAEGARTEPGTPGTPPWPLSLPLRGSSSASAGAALSRRADKGPLPVKILRRFFKIRLFASLGTRGQTLHVPSPPWPGTQQQLGLPRLPQPGQAKAGGNPEFRMKGGPGEGTAPWRPPQPLHNPGCLQPPPEMVSFDKCFKAATDGPIPPPPPPAQPQPLLSGQNNRVLVKISVCPPPMCHDQYTRQRTGSVRWGAAVPWGCRGTRGCGGCLCVSSKTISPAPGEAGRIPQRGDAVVGDPTLAEPLHPGALHRPAPAPREQPRGLGGLRL